MNQPLGDDAKHILIVDDDDRIRDLLKRFLQRDGYRITACASAADARRMFDMLTFDLAILDIMMPGEDGLSLLHTIRNGNEHRLPVILLTAKGTASERIEGLKSGADDYLVKPFEPEELSLRCASILRRIVEDVTPEDIRMSGLVFHIKRGELMKDDQRIRLTEAEQQLLTALASRAGEAVSREQLAALTSAGLERSVDVQVTRLRKKIEPNPREPIHLQTVRGVGYRLLPD